MSVHERVVGSYKIEENPNSSYLANVNESTHEVLVTERRYSILSLLPRCVFHNPKIPKLDRFAKCNKQRPRHLEEWLLTRSPTLTGSPNPNPSIQRPSK